MNTNVSFVVQGPEVPMITRNLFSSINIFYPYAETIFSTWASSEIPCNRIIINDDPGDSQGTNQKNLNRFLYSSQKGCEAASHPLIIRLRSDLNLFSNGLQIFLDQFHELDGAVGTPKDRKGYRTVSNRIIMGSVYTVDPAGSFKLPFHISDWWHLGNRNDLLNLYNIPFASLETCGNTKYRNEQYIWIKFLQKHGFNVNIKFDEDNSKENIQATYESIIDNCFIIDNYKAGIINSKYPEINNYHPALLSSQKFLQLCTIFT